MRLGTMKENGYTLILYCVPDHLVTCHHSANADLDALIEKFGADFETASRRAWFLSHFKCQKCGRRSVDMRIANPPYVSPTYNQKLFW